MPTDDLFGHLLRYLMGMEDPEVVEPEPQGPDPSGRVVRGGEMIKYSVKNQDGIVEHEGSEQECRQYIRNVEDLWARSGLCLYVNDGKEESMLD